MITVGYCTFARSSIPVTSRNAVSISSHSSVLCRHFQAKPTYVSTGISGDDIVVFRPEIVGCLVVEILEPFLEPIREAVKDCFLSFAFPEVLLGVYVRPEFIRTDEPRRYLRCESIADLRHFYRRPRGPNVLMGGDRPLERLGWISGPPNTQRHGSHGFTHDAAKQPTRPRGHGC